MINIIDKKDCCGCGACVQRCPKKCIDLREDNEGFLYPIVNKDLCIDCDLCEKVCPVITQGKKRNPQRVYAMKSHNEDIRMQSSSGGAFTLIAKEVIARGGVVFGARFDEKFNVIFDFTESLEGLAPFRGSKYVQARIEQTYTAAEQFLKDGREVLFSGTPCQIAGLKTFLRREYDNLITIDFVCHGVPSPKVWQRYLVEFSRSLVAKEISDTGLQNIPPYKIDYINFRNKVSGWKRYSFQIKLNFDLPNGKNRKIDFHHRFFEDRYMRAFLGDTILRPSCYTCPSKLGKSGSDITIADYWNVPQVDPSFDDDKGVGLVMINSEKGAELYQFNQDGAETKEITFRQAKGYNTGFKERIKKTKRRYMLFEQLDSTDNIIELLRESVKPTLWDIIVKRFKKFKRKVLKR